MNPRSDRGWIRLIEFPKGQGERIRPSGRTWDTGGTFSVNLRVVDIHRKTAQLRTRSWHDYSEPLRVSFSQFVVWEALMRDPHDEVLALLCAWLSTHYGYQQDPLWSDLSAELKCLVPFALIICAPAAVATICGPTKLDPGVARPLFYD